MRCRGAVFSALLAIYRHNVGLSKTYVTSLYWALTMVMKSPWLPPRATGEQMFACSIVVLGAVVFAIFLGQVPFAPPPKKKSSPSLSLSLSLSLSFEAVHTAVLACA